MRFREAKQRITALGYKLDRVKGSHHIFVKGMKEFIICKHSRDVHKFCERDIKVLEDEHSRETRQRVTAVHTLLEDQGHDGGVPQAPQDDAAVQEGGEGPAHPEAQQEAEEGNGRDILLRIRNPKTGKYSDKELNLVNEAVFMWRHYSPSNISPSLQKLTNDHYHYTFSKGYFLGALRHQERLLEADDILFKIIMKEPGAMDELFKYLHTYYPSES